MRGGGIGVISINSGTGNTEVWLDNLIVRNNSGYFAGGINVYVSDGLVRVVNSVFDNNVTGDDLDGNLRVRSGILDIGAYENQVTVFANGFE